MEQTCWMDENFKKKQHDNMRKKNIIENDWLEFMSAHEDWVRMFLGSCRAFLQIQNDNQFKITIKELMDPVRERKIH